MKIIINESQLRLIVENEGEDNLIDFTYVYRGGFPPEEWDDIFLLLKEKKERKGDKTYDGYYIDGVVDLYGSDVTELKYLVKVGGHLDLDRTPIKSLPMLKYVGGSLNLNQSQIKSLPMLSYVESFLSLNNTPIEELPELKKVGSLLSLRDSQIKSLPLLKSVGGDLDLRRTPLSDSTTKGELRKQINIKVDIYL